MSLFIVVVMSLISMTLDLPANTQDLPPNNPNLPANSPDLPANDSDQPDDSEDLSEDDEDSAMAHGGTWTSEQGTFLVVMKLCTTYTWNQIADRFREQFPDTTVTGKDCESKFNKYWAYKWERFWVEQFKEAAIIPQSEEGQRVIADLVVYLGDTPHEYRLL